MLWKPITVLLIVCASHAWAQTPMSEQLQFFESEVRPLLANHCYRCHSSQATKLKAGLRLDSIAGMLRGGETGTAVVPGDAEQSLLIEAVRYTGLEMPPSGKLPAQQIAVLEKWVSMGAPWPYEPEANAVLGAEEFDWRERSAEHWCWRPVETVRPPDVEDSAWPLNPIDRFILARLESAGLRPAGDADKRTWIRRVFFDLIGLPPNPRQVSTFLADGSTNAYEKVVDELLRSPHFGEKWARHWLDLVRYGETLGHEFDYPLHHAYQYRDYVIRAFNADVPYDQFLREHIAGDLLEEPRRHSTERYNESIIGTGFWFLGEACHAPTDVKADEADRIDNQIDVFAKAFLGLTVACARCHDHKFDPIPTQDYYGLAGYMQSSRRHEALLDPGGKIHAARRRLERLADEGFQVWRESLPSIQVDPGVVKRSLVAILNSKDEQTVAALDSPTHPFYALAKLHSADDYRTQRVELFHELQTLRKAASEATNKTELYFDFAKADGGAWYFTGQAFDEQPTRLGQLQASGLPPFARPHAIHSGRFGTQLRGVLRSPTFVLQHNRIHYKMNGRDVTVRLIVDGYTMDEFNPLLFRDMRYRVDTDGQAKWISQTKDLYHYVGHRAHLEIIDDGDGFAALEQIRFSDEGAPADAPHPFNFASVADVANSSDGIIDLCVSETAASWKRFQNQQAHTSDIEIVNWLVDVRAVRMPPQAETLMQEMAAVNHNIPAPMSVIALADGDAENEFVFVRGNHKNLGPEAPRRMLVAIAGDEQSQHGAGSGRLNLAYRVTDASNPLTTRVIVNRLWHYLFGRGIVSTVDDFGKMGRPPSHPQLLDWLASDFVQNQDWSIKGAIRQIVLSRTYGMSSRVTADLAGVRSIDPENTLLHRSPIRRLTGEAIRDALLTLSGRLDLAMFGPSVPLHLNAFMEGRGRPAESGPQDGNGRRSLYIEVRRNFLSPMMSTFDRPSPFSTMGRRSNSNVPAQSLMLLNDPFVLSQAEGWARQIVDADDDAEVRIRLAFEMAFSQQPTPLQLQRCVEFVENQLNPELAWKHLCHMLVNMKPFIFLN